MIRIGKIVAAHGLQGAVILVHFAGTRTWLKPGDALLVEMVRDSRIPYFVSAVKAIKEDELILTIEDIATVEAAKRLVSKQVWVDVDMLKGIARSSPLLWIGFTVSDVNKGVLGPILDVVQTGKQWLAKLTIADKEVLLPLVEQMIEKIDVRKQTILMDLPEGLLEVYLDN